MPKKKVYHLDLTVADGKYRFQQRNAGGRVDVLRYGEPWITDIFNDGKLPGLNALMAALFELEAIKASTK